MIAQLNISMEASEYTGLSGGNTVSCCYDYDHDVTAYSLGGKTYIDLVEISTSYVYNVELASDIEVMDMFVHNDLLFFCGRDSRRQIGIVGYLNIPDIPLMLPITTKYFEVSSVFFLNKMVVNNDAGSYHVSALGQDLWPNQPSLFYNNLLVDIPDITAVGYNVFNFNYYEKYYDLLLTERQIVCFGYDTDPAVTSICYRKAERHNITASPLFDSIHFFFRGDDAYSITHSTELDSGRIATAYFYMTGSASSTRIRTIDVVHDIMTYSFEFTIPDKGEPKHLTFLPAKRKLVVMQDYLFGGTYNSNFIIFDPLIVSPTGKIDYMPTNLFQHLAKHNLKYYLASSGSYWFWKDGAMVPTGFPSSNCPIETTINIHDIRTLQHQVILDGLTPSPATGYLTSPAHSITSYMFTPGCSNQ